MRQPEWFTCLTVNAASLAAFAIVEAEGSGEGQIVDTFIFDTTAAACRMMSLSRRDLDGAPAEPPQVMADSAIYRCRDGKFVAIATLEDHLWSDFLNAGTREGHPLRSEAFRTRQGRDALDDPHLHERGCIGM